MALINIISNGTQAINWELLYADYKRLELLNVELFPIPKELGFDHDSVGICIHKNYSDKDKVIKELKELILLLEKESYKLKFYELYNSVEISSFNVENVLNPLLPR